MWFVVDDRPRVIVQEQHGCLRGCVNAGCLAVSYLVVGTILLLGLLFVASLFFA